jgi:hypothetical protein
MGIWSAIFKSRAQDWIFQKLDPAQVVRGPATPVVEQPASVEPDKHYLTVRLLSMRLVNVREGLTRLYGAVHSWASLPRLGSEPAQFNALVSPAQLRGVDAKRLDRVVQVNQTLFGPVPFRGGPLELEIALFSIESQDLTEPFLSLLESLSGLAGVSYVAKALPFAEPLKLGIGLLTGRGGDASVLEVGFAAEQWVPAPGVWVNMRATAQQAPIKDLRVEGDDYKLTLRGQPVLDFPYLIIEVTADTKRPTWFEVPELRDSYNALRDLVRRGTVQEAQDALAVFRRTALTCSDLLFDDARSLVAKVQQETQEVLGPATPGSRGFEREFAEPTMRPLSTIRLYD